MLCFLDVLFELRKKPLEDHTTNKIRLYIWLYCAQTTHAETIWNKLIKRRIGCLEEYFKEVYRIYWAPNQ